MKRTNCVANEQLTRVFSCCRRRERASILPGKQGLVSDKAASRMKHEKPPYTSTDTLGIENRAYNIDKDFRSAKTAQPLN